MKVIVVGCGSIGKRHITNLLGLNTIKEILVYTHSPARLNYFGKQRKIIFIDSLDKAEADFAIIANKTYKHLPVAISLAKKGIHLFIEKPVSHNLAGIKLLRAAVKKNRIKVFVAYNMRFLGAINYIKKLLSQGAIGKPYFAKIEAGSFLPSWRPLTDYWSCYSASSKMGGGVALDLSHEIDYMRYLFGDPRQWSVLKTKVSNLKLDSDDVFEGIYLYKGGFICGVHLDYLQRTARRKIRIVGSNGFIVADLIDKYIRVVKSERGKIVRDSRLFDMNRTYKDELEAFILNIVNNTDPRVSLDDGIKVLGLIRNN